MNGVPNGLVRYLNPTEYHQDLISNASLKENGCSEVLFCRTAYQQIGVNLVLYKQFAIFGAVFLLVMACQSRAIRGWSQLDFCVANQI